MSCYRAVREHVFVKSLSLHQKQSSFADLFRWVLRLCIDRFLVGARLQPVFILEKEVVRVTGTRWLFWRWNNFLHRLWSWGANGLYVLGVSGRRRRSDDARVSWLGTVVRGRQLSAAIRTLLKIYGAIAQ